MLTPDLQMARDHLELIGTRQHGSDGTFVFVLIHDKRRAHTKQVTATLDDALPKLMLFQAKGFGVFVIPQLTGGRKVPDIERVRSLAFDFDDERPFEALATLPLRPSAILQTPRGWHIYIECDEADPTWAEIDKVSALHKALGHQLGADKGALNLAQPMRLAGFYHLKADPVMITLQSLSYGTARSFAEVAACIPAKLHEESPLVSLSSGVKYPFPILRRVLRQCCQKIRTAKKGTRFNTVRACAFRLGCYVPVGLDIDVARAWVQLAVRDLADAGLAREVERRLSSILDAGQREGLRNPPTPPPSVIERLAREQWAADLVDRMQWDRIVICDALRRHPGWKTCGTRKQAEHALGQALRSAGYTHRVIRDGKPQRVFMRNPASGDKTGEG